ncbi:MAG TPA: helix-turn-helix domain-containing protein [Chitinophagaceae bacterium]
MLLFISGFGILQGVLLAALLYFHPKCDRSVTTFLAFFILFVSIPILIPVGQHLFSWQFIIFVDPFTVLIGPFLYLYVRSFKEVITWQKAWPHFIIFLIYLLIDYWLYAEVGSKYPLSQTVPPEVTRHPLSFIPVSIRLLQRVLYYFLSLKQLKSYQRSIGHFFSETSRINLNWVKWLINGYLLLVLITIIFYSLILKYPQHFNNWVLLIGVFVSVYIYIAFFKGITQPTLWQLQPGKNKEKIEAEIKEADSIEQGQGGKNMSRKTGLSKSKIEEIVGKIISIMESEKIYQETELTLTQMATRLQLPSHHLSQAINEGLKKNFYDLVNGYRVEEAKRLLLDTRNSNYTILSIGFEAGFNSKTTFNTVFKKFTGLTPTEYRDKQKIPVTVT